MTNIASNIRTAETLDEMLSMLLGETLKTLNTDTGAIWLNYVSPSALHILKARGWLKTLEEEDFMPDQEQGIIGQVFLFREPYGSRDIASDPLLKPVAGTRIPEGWSGIFVPLIMDNEPVGILFVSMELPRMIKSEEYNLLILLADMAGTAIHRLNLHEETLRQLHWLEATNAVDIAISSSLDLKSTTKVLLNQIITQAEANAALERQIHKCSAEKVEAAGNEDWLSILKADNFADCVCVPLIAKGVAFKMLSSIEYLRPALNIPYCHHERYDGSGYPQGLKGDEIPLEARLFAVIDVYDALTSDRPYRKAWSKEKTIAHIKEQSGEHFDPQVVEVFLKTIVSA